MHFEIFAQVIESLNGRSDTDSFRFFKSSETFTIGQLGDVKKKKVIPSQESNTHPTPEFYLFCQP